MTTETPTPLVDATIIRLHLAEAKLSQRSAAGVLRIDERTMRRYCSGDLPVPPYVILALMQVSQMHRNAEVVALLDSGKISTSEGPLTKEQLVPQGTDRHRLRPPRGCCTKKAAVAIDKRFVELGARMPAVIGRRLKSRVPFTAIDVIWLSP